MKRSKKIELVIVTAVLASCNGHIIPSQSALGTRIDTALTASPEYNNTVNCTCQQADASNKNYLLNSSGINYFNELGNIYYPGRLYRKGAFWRNNYFVVRGGFGKRAYSAVS
jgi:hypothetical protein